MFIYITRYSVIIIHERDKRVRFVAAFFLGERIFVHNTIHHRILSFMTWTAIYFLRSQRQAPVFRTENFETFLHVRVRKTRPTLTVAQSTVLLCTRVAIGITRHNTSYRHGCVIGAAVMRKRIIENARPVYTNTPDVVRFCVRNVSRV